MVDCEFAIHPAAEITGTFRGYLQRLTAARKFTGRPLRSSDHLTSRSRCFDAPPVNLRESRPAACDRTTLLEEGASQELVVPGLCLSPGVTGFVSKLSRRRGCYSKGRKVNFEIVCMCSSRSGACMVQSQFVGKRYGFISPRTRSPKRC